MKIAIMGSGGIGGYMGGRLAAAGEDVVFVARGRHLEAMRSQGLRIVSALGDVKLPKVDATADPSTIGPVDVVVFGVKLYDAASAATAIRPLLKDGSVVIPFLNGIDAPDTVAAAVGAEAAAGGVIRISSVIEAPGVIRHNGTLCDCIVGPLLPAQRAVVAGFQAALSKAGVATRLSDDIRTEMWKKMIFIASFAALTAATRAPCGVFRRDPELAAMFRGAVAEATAVARACGAVLPDTMVDDVWGNVQKLPDGMPSSMLYDLEQGKPLELPWLSGALVRLGRDRGVPTPVHAFIAAVLAPWVNGKPAPAA